MTKVRSLDRGPYAAAALKKANEWLARHGHVIGLSAAGVVGTYFVISGIAQLV